jgi:hypothetical protein
MSGCARSSSDWLSPRRKKQRAKPFFVCVGSFRPLSCKRYFHAVKSRFWRRSSKCASVRVGRNRFHASSNSAFASSNVTGSISRLSGIAARIETAVPAPPVLVDRDAGTVSD